MDSSGALKKPTVLIVDNERLNVHLLQAMLKKGGFATLPAYSGVEAREIAKAEKPDIILLDIVMPGENGFQTCEKLKQDPDTTEIPIIFISSMGDVDTKVKGLSIGAVDYITKPFEIAEVQTRIRLHLRLSMAHQALVREQAEKLRRLHAAQQAILVRPEDIPEARFAVSYLSVQEAGADFYDVATIGEGITAYFVADISGHDLGASYLSSMLKALFSQNASPMYTPLETLRIMNTVLASVLPPEMYGTACYLHLNRQQASMTYLSAGHPPGIRVRSGEASLLDAQGDVLGGFETAYFEPVTMKVDPGERIYLFTDGLIEGFGANMMHRAEGVDILCSHCVNASGMALAEAVPWIMSQVASKNAQDDLLLLGLEV
ncbi:MAG: phosphoserine phosphatase RsbU/P [Desulfovibrionales bacterium]|jgi:sigma-B regulation protein RsbU (phosphoserine phosphatase)|nr:phosphoserine phosphatase RsbU/P [Desulfovibrionales bacterium]